MLWKENYFIFVILYVDDILVSSNNFTKLDEFKVQMRKQFKIKELGNVNNFLGISIHYDRENKVVELDQINLIEKVLARFGMLDSDTKSTPMERKLDLRRSEGNTSKPYRELIGCLMYIMLGTRPDISFCVAYFSRFQDRASEQHYNYLLRVLQYLKGTKNLKLRYEIDTNFGLTGYADADWAGDTHDRKSTSGYLFKLFNSTLVWSSRKQDLVALSTAESEFIAFSSAVTEAVFMKNLLEDFQVKLQSPVVIYEDNRSCIAIASNPNTTKRTKHFDVRLHFVKDYIVKKLIKPEDIESNENIADMMTKALDKEKLCYLRSKLGLV